MVGKLESLNIGTIDEVEHNGLQVSTGIFKRPTDEPQRVAGTNVGADRQADLKNHGGTHKAVYAYASEDYQWWETELDRELPPGMFGENLTTRGIDVSGAQVGDRWSIGSVVLEVSEPRIPCFKLGIRVEQSRFQQAFTKANRPGAYLRIVDEGDIVVGQDITVTATSQPTMTVADVARIYSVDKGEASALLNVAQLSDKWRSWAHKQLEKTS